MVPFFITPELYTCDESQKGRNSLTLCLKSTYTFKIHRKNSININVYLIGVEVLPFVRLSINKNYKFNYKVGDIRSHSSLSMKELVSQNRLRI